ncbi:MAG: hypothetical protein H6492_01960 [Candidatus Paracaedibacteraceae bacterium]|nr:hypothetical protein [Candidatus Paracaedibacteraceae bacterium]
MTVLGHIDLGQFPTSQADQPYINMVRPLCVVQILPEKEQARLLKQIS